MSENTDEKLRGIEIVESPRSYMEMTRPVIQCDIIVNTGKQNGIKSPSTNSNCRVIYDSHISVINLGKRI